MSAQCRQRVAKLFDETWPKRTLDAAGAQVNFEDHYSAKQKRCFFLETVSRLTHSPALKRILPRETQRLSDAVARRDYGKYDAWDDMPPLTCWLQETKCSSKEEWQQLIKPFMQD